mmetsp:Transcript_32680/g.93906  ORF Transcript_32680/g.93906 Transcript_32680/m.93906 type:complete len:102 (+) Transcript_32680:27-332(+)
MHKRHSSRPVTVSQFNILQQLGSKSLHFLVMAEREVKRRKSFAIAGICTLTLPLDLAASKVVGAALLMIKRRPLPFSWIFMLTVRKQPHLITSEFGFWRST